ncbi:MAG: CRISPR-associated helicase Cas3' [Propioniciclava sp.]
MSDFDSFFQDATGVLPYPYQRRMAAQGLPEVVEIPTGLGKTAAAVLPWLYRRRSHPDLDVRAATPRREVIALPARVLVEQTGAKVRQWLANLGLENDVDVAVLMGGEPLWFNERYWAEQPERDSVIIGTIDMVLSRCLMRGYGSSRGMWPIDFAILNNDTQFIFDEVQLLGPGLSTARQLQAFRDQLGTYLPTHSTYMSATMNRRRLNTVDAVAPASEILLQADDLDSERVLRRFQASKTVRQLSISDPKKQALELAQHVVDHHRPGTLSLSISNTVDRAIDTYRAVKKLQPQADVELLHSRFRPGDRQKIVSRVTSSPDGVEGGRIVISTQVVEAGVDISAAVLTTEVAPWSSLVQRAGRCNRAGEFDDPGSERAQWWWVGLADRSAPPYEVSDLQASSQALQSLEGEAVTSRGLAELAVPELDPIHQVLRRRDLMELFDTSPDLSGNDIDVARFIRGDSDDSDLAVAWRSGVIKPDDGSDESTPAREERCPVPVAQFRDWWRKLDSGRRKGVKIWSVEDRTWRQCDRGDLRPGAVVLVDALLGGYTSELGWAPKSKEVVGPPEGPDSGSDQSVQRSLADETDEDALSSLDTWTTLSNHLQDAQREATDLLERMSAPVPPDHAAAVIQAAALHDVGKAHDVFQTAVRQIADTAGVTVPDGMLFAKTGVPRARMRYSRQGFRHELVSALWVRHIAANQESAQIFIDDPDLISYLVAAHHGKVRLSLRGHQADRTEFGVAKSNGVHEGDQVDGFSLQGRDLPSLVVDLGSQRLGGQEDSRSWNEGVLGVLHRDELGPFKLALLEALVRLADFLASATPTPTRIDSIGMEVAK